MFYRLNPDETKHKKVQNWLPFSQAMFDFWAQSSFDI
jgi:hypothetical protein